MQEIWLPIPGYEGFYEASCLGLIRSVSRFAQRSNGAKFKKHGRILAPQWANRRYASVSISVNGLIKTVPVHRLVARTFVPNPLCLSEVNHIDGQRSNNAASNLEWVSRAQNNDHAIKTGLKPPVLGSRHGMAKLSEDQVIEIRKLRSSGVKGVDVARIFNITPQAVSEIHRKKYWTHI